MVIEKKTETQKGQVQPRDVRRQYFLGKNGKSVWVCQVFFQQTLNVGRQLIEYTLSNKTASGMPPPDKRGKHQSANKYSDTQIKSVKEHINSFPKMESHYCRSTTTRQYLDCGLNVKKMYNDFVMQEPNPVSEKKYRDIFNFEFNLGFHRPKKDQCIDCLKFLHNPDPTETQKKEYNDHIRQKERARQEKQNDNEKAAQSENNSFIVATFDLESVLYTPKTQAGQLYYTQKLAVYNFTIYEHNTKMGFVTCGMKVMAEEGLMKSVHLL